MNRIHLKTLPTPVKVLAAGSFAALTGFAPLAGSAFAVSTSGSTALTTTQQQHLQTIISKGDAEIARRLTTLNTLTAKINAATKLSASDKTTLSNEVASTITGLTNLKTQLDSETTLTAAKADAQAIYTQYRVYALVAPKVGLIKVADDQQAVEARLNALASKLQSRITAAQAANKDVSTLQSELSDLQAKIATSQTISAKIESDVIGLQPTDYNNDHAILSGDRDQLKTARTDNQAAVADAKNIIAGLKSVK